MVAGGVGEVCIVARGGWGVGGMCGHLWGVHGCSQGGMHGCSRGGMCGCSGGGMHGKGVCMVKGVCGEGGCAWQKGGMHGKGGHEG